MRERVGKFAGRSIAQTELVVFAGEDGRTLAELYRRARPRCVSWRALLAGPVERPHATQELIRCV